MLTVQQVAANKSIKNCSGNINRLSSGLNFSGKCFPAQSAWQQTESMQSIFQYQIKNGDYSFVEQMQLLDLFESNHAADLEEERTGIEKVRVLFSSNSRNIETLNFDRIIQNLSILPTLKVDALELNPEVFAKAFSKINNIFDSDSSSNHMLVISFDFLRLRERERTLTAWQNYNLSPLYQVAAALRGMYQYCDIAEDKISRGELSTSAELEAFKEFLENSRDRFLRRSAISNIARVADELEIDLSLEPELPKEPFSIEDFCLSVSAEKIGLYKTVITTLEVSDFCDREEFEHHIFQETSKFEKDEGIISCYYNGWGDDLDSPVLNTAGVRQHLSNLIRASALISDSVSRKTCELSFDLMCYSLNDLDRSDYNDNKDYTALDFFLKSENYRKGLSEDEIDPNTIILTKSQRKFAAGFLGMLVVLESGLLDPDSSYGSAETTSQSAASIKTFMSDILDRRQQRLSKIEFKRQSDGIADQVADLF
jgi:hypothetical protein